MNIYNLATRTLQYALLAFLSWFIPASATAEIIKDPATWTFEAKKKEGNKYELIFHLTLKEGWHIWSLIPGGDGTLISPSFKFAKDSNVKLIGKVKEKGNKITGDDGLGNIANWFETKVDYIQLVEVSGNLNITGKHGYQVCDKSQCLKEKIKPFSFIITDAGGPIVADTVAAAPMQSNISPGGAAPANGKAVDTNKKTTEKGKPKASEKPSQSLLQLFLLALGGGILAVLTPCVFSMIPITVSFFTKRSKTKEEGIRNALYYSLSIILIFTLLGVLISLIFGVNALNNLSTNWIANLFFFAIFVIFGISFLGAFEITLPSSWTNKTDSKANIQSFGGIFFMALTLVIVSFSCTGPIIGPLLVLTAKGSILGPVLGMFGFSLGLAMPFAIFAVFPGLLNKLAQSGGWLNQVKVTLGFIELALALKFLSNADLAKQWRLLDREVFIAIWIVLAILLGIYLLGKLKLSHDDASVKNIYGQDYVSIFKLFLAIVCFSFAVYLVPGMWGAPLNAMSQFVPPMGTQDFVLGGNSIGNSSNNDAAAKPIDGISIEPMRYVNMMKIYEPEIVKKFGLVVYYDYDEALAAAKKLKKPIMLDFTGINCVNCRKMESQVWSNPEVMKRLKNDFIIVSLYCDYDKIDLPEKEQYFSKALQSQVMTLGDKNEDLQASKFNANSQPFYFYVDEDGIKLVEDGYGYDSDAAKFIKHLDKAKENYISQNRYQ